MSDASWTLNVTPTAAENYEAMTRVGQASLRGSRRAVLIAQSLFTGFFAPVGATMVFWMIMTVLGGIPFADLPAAAIPVTLVVFGGLAFWLSRQGHYLTAKLTAQSRFGRGYEATVNAHGITVVTSSSHWHSGWADVSVVRGGKTTLAVGISGIVIPLPRRAFLGPQDADEALCEMLEWQGAAQ